MDIEKADPSGEEIEEKGQLETEHQQLETNVSSEARKTMEPLTVKKRPPPHVTSMDQVPPPSKRPASLGGTTSSRNSNSISKHNPKQFQRGRSSIGAVPPPGLPLNAATSGAIHLHANYGNPIFVKESRGNFPLVGSILGNFFCLGQLGKGTFSSVHKCINLEYYYPPKEAKDTQEDDDTAFKSEESKTEAEIKKEEKERKALESFNQSRRRLAAAKVELHTFAQSGVLESEATILHFLHEHLPPDTVPVYMGHYKSPQYAAIMMEYLPGEDMNQLRETIIRKSRRRRLHVEDAVYLTADVFLPLLQRMHSVGIVHRDVKPSNAVRMADSKRNVSSQSRAKFCLVDFGLSKSIVVPQDSPIADRPWPKENAWLKPAKYDGLGCYRKERESADFRGSSMYASLRVHQSKDYCPRDDVWSVLYVFCDLVSGGLPWMSNAANKERHECGNMKERIQGEGEGVTKDEMFMLLMGDEYHVAKHRQDYKIASAKKQGLPPPQLSPLPEPLPLSTDENLVGHLRRAFQHLATLQFWDTPDYDLIRDCIHGFLKHPEKWPDAPKIQWDNLRSSRPTTPVGDANPQKKSQQWNLVSEPHDPACLVNTDNLYVDAQEQATTENQEQDDLIPDPRSKLPIDLQFALEQMTSHAANVDSVPKHIALRDWFQVTLPLVKHQVWDVQQYEASHRKTGDDGFRRPFYLKLLRQCQEWAALFDNFCHASCFFHDPKDLPPSNKTDVSGEEPKTCLGLRRRTIVTEKPQTDMIMLSRTLTSLKLKIDAERKRPSAPPMPISFGMG